MSYRRYRDVIGARVGECPFDRLNPFCQDVVLRILGYVDEEALRGMWEREVTLVEELATTARNSEVSWSAVETHAIETDAQVTEFLCAMDNWRELNSTRQPSFAAAVSENMMNILDYNHAQEADLENWLSVPELRVEYESSCHSWRKKPNKCLKLTTPSLLAQGFPPRRSAIPVAA